MNNKPYDITKIEELHRLRADKHEIRKSWTDEELMRQTKLSNERGRKVWEQLRSRKREEVGV